MIRAEGVVGLAPIVLGFTMTAIGLFEVVALLAALVGGKDACDGTVGLVMFARMPVTVIPDDSFNIYMSLYFLQPKRYCFSPVVCT